MIFTYNATKKQIIIDNEDHYFVGDVGQNLFPEVIRDSYEDIILRSFNGHVDESTKIAHTFENDIYKILFDFNCKPLIFQTVVDIQMVKHQKDYKDYMNERVSKLEATIKKLTEQIETIIEMKKGDVLETADVPETVETQESQETQVVEKPIKHSGGKKKVAKVIDV